MVGEVTCLYLALQVFPSVRSLQYVPGLGQLSGQLYAYIFAEIISAAIWAKYLEADPLEPYAGLLIRRALFEASSTKHITASVQELLGTGCLRRVMLSEVQSTDSAHVLGWIPNLEHTAYQDIDLWG